MRLLSFALCALLLTMGCSYNSKHNKPAELQVETFYRDYLNNISAENPMPPLKNIGDFVSKDTLERLDKISRMPDQDIIYSDYFTYTQDYDPSWIKRLKVGKPKKFMGGEIVDVWLGIEDNKSIHLMTYLRRENRKWKIYRVRDITNNFEQNIFDSKIW